MKRKTMSLAILALALAAAGCPPQVGMPPNNPNTPPQQPDPPALFRLGIFASIDGAGHNESHPDWGTAESLLLRMMPPSYEDGIETPAAGRPSARAISNAVAAQDAPRPNVHNLTDMFWQWGQFLDHDLSLVPVFDPVIAYDIPVPADDTWFDPNGSGEVSIPLERSYFEYSDGAAQQLNEITAYIDASNVYGSDQTRADALRAFDGTGRLNTSAGDLLPFNTTGLPNAPSNEAVWFLAGDFRANEQVYLTAMHTLFVREHNYWAKRLAVVHPEWDGNQLYRTARAMVAAEIQIITYRDFLPLLLGASALPPYAGYQPAVNAGIRNEFTTAAFRFGHTMLSPELLRLDAHLNVVPAGNLSLASAFFNPQELIDLGIDPYLRGLTHQAAQEIDPYIVDGVRNFLFGPPGAGGLDLPALNIQRGRDHGLPSYSEMRMMLGLGAARGVEDISSDPEVQRRLAAVYDSVEHIDLWVGGLAEDKLPGALVGPTFHRILRAQFIALRDGDRFWYQHYLPPDMIQRLEQESLATIIRRNTAIGAEIPDNVFLLP